MRFPRPLPGGSSLELTAFFLNRSLCSRMLMLGLPLLALALLLIVLLTGKAVDTVLNRAIARNAQLQTQAMRLALEETLAETRNQLLILAAGSMDLRAMTERFRFRVRTKGLRYREVAFMGIAPEDRYVLINHEGKVISVPPKTALESPTGPFHHMCGEQRPGYVTVGQPLEAVYSLVPMDGAMQTVALYVLRFSTPVYDSQGKFTGCLLLSLDLRELRDTISAYSAPEAPIAAEAETRVRSLFFDREGWMLFQSEPKDASLRKKSLNTDIVRAGFAGDFGRPGFNLAFRPGPDHLSYWSMVADVQEGRSGQLPMRESVTVWSNGQMRVERVSYVPVSFQPEVAAPPVVLGGLAVLDTSFTTTRTGMQIMSIYIAAFGGGFLLLGLSLWWLARQMSGSLHSVTRRLQERNAADSAAPLGLPPLPVELERLRAGIDALLERLRLTKELCRSQEAEHNAQWRREPVLDLPHPQDLPAHGLVGNSPPMRALYEQVRKAAQVTADVLVVGETGTGKELVSAAIHRLSARHAGPFITINCGALDESLLMDTLFGHTKGAFTEAKQSRKGAFLAACGGTLMLDEVGNAAPKVQQALLRALSTRCIRPLGSDQDVPFDTRIIAATNTPLLDAARSGGFREDLYYRLAVITIHTPPLRKRREDIPELTVCFLTAAHEAAVRKALAEGKPAPTGPPRLSRGALARLMAHSWPGNVRELKNTLTRALAFCEGDLLQEENIQLPLPGSPAPPQTPPGTRPPTAPADNQETPTDAQDAGAPAGPLVRRVPAPQAPDAPDAADAADAPDAPDSAPPTAAPEPDVLLLAARRAGQEGRLNRRILRTWPLLTAKGSVSRQEYQGLVGEDISVRTALYDLQLLVTLGLLRREGRGPAQRYLLTDLGKTAVAPQSQTHGTSQKAVEP